MREGQQGRGKTRRERRTNLDLLANVFLLLRLERELNEDLLQLLVDVVDAKLLELVGLYSSNRVSLALARLGSALELTSKISKP